MNGLLVFDKPTGMTSRDLVNRVQARLPKTVRLGHTGTLDPLATGTLVLCVGQATRLASLVQEMTKIYRTTLRFGSTSTTDDADGTITAHPGARLVMQTDLLALLPRFTGFIEQVPPDYSAIKVDGQRSYDLARQGESVELAPRTVHVHTIECERCDGSEAELRITCGKGTYIRSIVRDLGELLGVGAYVTALRRESVGPFEAARGLRLDTLPLNISTVLQPMDQALQNLARIELSAEAGAAFRQGRAVPLTIPIPTESTGPKTVAVFSTAGVLGLGEAT
ncbi:MAG: tRNA pseudouridine(55) synthase TruB, partial [Gemmataceae bacterium]